MGTTISGLVYPETNDPVDVPQDIKDLADSITPHLRYPLCVVYKADAVDTDRQFIESGGAGEDVTWTAERIDTGGFHSTSVNPARVTPDRAGYYEVDVKIIWAQDAGPDSEVGERRVTIMKNGAGLAPIGREIVGENNSYSIECGTTTIVGMNGTTDYITARVFQNTGNGKYLYSSGTFTCYMSVKYLRELFEG